MFAAVDRPGTDPDNSSRTLMLFPPREVRRPLGGDRVPKPPCPCSPPLSRRQFWARKVMRGLRRPLLCERLGHIRTLPLFRWWPELQQYSQS